MNEQINIRMPDKLLEKAKRKAEEKGFSTVQDFIKELIRADVFDSESLTKNELLLVSQAISLSESKSLYGTEKDLAMVLEDK